MISAFFHESLQAQEFYFCKGLRIAASMSRKIMRWAGGVLRWVLAGNPYFAKDI